MLLKHIVVNYTKIMYYVRPLFTIFTAVDSLLLYFTRTQNTNIITRILITTKTLNLRESKLVLRNFGCFKKKNHFIEVFFSLKLLFSIGIKYIFIICVIVILLIYYRIHNTETVCVHAYVFFFSDNARAADEAQHSNDKFPR